ncbi:hypothetical protein [Actinomadura parmotrematis]|uniref:Uncharacterized protein n=1 Tax=Actinomadura parmotrematis TaxID=2864039 RepID=A0ABS7FY44_9ACTN|nr:hypothetical protein [Actinomadura parmotrematis]MBW8484512.1 hypothetical protein [Actinomadura parmotrematis]
MTAVDELRDAYFGAVLHRRDGDRDEWRAELPLGRGRIAVTLTSAAGPPAGDPAGRLAAARGPVRRILAREPEIRRAAAAALLPAARDWTEAAAGRRALHLPKIVSDAADIERRIVPAGLLLEPSPGLGGRRTARLSYRDDGIFRNQTIYAGIEVGEDGSVEFTEAYFG